MSKETAVGETVHMNASQKAYELTSQLFYEMLEHLKILCATNGTLSESQMKEQFRNLPLEIVEGFLSEAIHDGIIEERPRGTFTLQQVQVQQ
jgi:hypothetical protein